MRWLLVFLVACSKTSDPPPPPPTPAPAEVPAAAPTPGLHMQVFAPTVNAKELPLSIGIETLGGLSTIVLARGTALPAHFSDTFSTSAEDQVSVEVNVTAGERPFAIDNLSLGKFQIYGLPPAPRGVPQIDVDLEIDAHGVLTASAVDRATGTSRSMRITGAPSAPIDRAGIDSALANQTANHDADVTKSVRVHAHIDLETLRLATERAVDEAGDKIPTELRQRVLRALVSAERINTDWSTGNAKAILAETEKLRAVAHDLSTKIYAASPP